MPRVAELLRRKQRLLERKEKQPDLEGVAQIEQALHDIDLELSQWEEREVAAPPIAPR